MNRVASLAFVALIGITVSPSYGQAPAAKSTPSTPAPAAKGYDAYALLKTRNIFDPNRRAMRSDAPPEFRAASNRTRPSFFTLTGTMVAEGRSLAFFSGSRMDFSKVLPIGEAVAGYKVLAITPVQVQLEHDGKNLVMAMGQRIQLEGSTDEVTGAEAAAMDANPSATPGAPADPNAPTSTIAPASNDKAEILRRLMERRQKEMSK